MGNLVDREIKKGATLPVVTMTLTDSDGPIDLTNTTVTFFMWADGDEDFKVEDVACSVVDADAGQVSWDPVAGDTDTPGLYKAIFKVTYAGGGVLIVPEENFFFIRVTDWGPGV